MIFNRSIICKAYFVQKQTFMKIALLNLIKNIAEKIVIG